MITIRRGDIIKYSGASYNPATKSFMIVVTADAKKVFAKRIEAFRGNVRYNYDIYLIQKSNIKMNRNSETSKCEIITTSIPDNMFTAIHDEIRKKQRGFKANIEECKLSVTSRTMREIIRAINNGWYPILKLYNRRHSDYLYVTVFGFKNLGCFEPFEGRRDERKHPINIAQIHRVERQCLKIK